MIYREASGCREATRENQRRRAQSNNDVVRRALQRLGVLQQGDRREREGGREPA